MKLTRMVPIFLLLGTGLFVRGNAFAFAPKVDQHVVDFNNGGYPKVDPDTGERIQPILYYSEIAARVRSRYLITDVIFFNESTLRLTTLRSDTQSYYRTQYISCERASQAQALARLLRDSSVSFELLLDNFDWHIPGQSYWDVPISSLRIFYPTTGAFVPLRQFLIGR